MANKKFTELPQADTITGAEVLAMVQDGVSVQGDIDLIKAYFDTLYAPVTPSRFTSSAQTITSAGSLTIAHGLGVQPFFVSAYLQCTTAENGYSIGDRVYQIFEISTSASDSRGVSLSTSGTVNIDVRFGSAASPFIVLNKSTGAQATLTNANWRLYVIAEA